MKEKKLFAPAGGGLGRTFFCDPTATVCTDDAVLLGPTIRVVPYPLVLASHATSKYLYKRWAPCTHFCNMWESMHVLIAMMLPDHTAKTSAARVRQV